MLLFGAAAGAQGEAETAAPAVSRPFEHASFDDLVVPDAEPEERLPLALALAAAGLESLGRGEHEAAARQLEVSYRLNADTELLLPLGLSLIRLDRHLAAAERLERYLAEGTSIAAEGRAQAERGLIEARSHFAALSVDTDPPGALLSVDGRPVGAAPLREPLVVTRGEHLLRARLDGYRDAVERLVIEGGAPQEVLLDLEPLLRPERRGLRVGLWVTVGIALASAAVLVPAVVLAVMRTDELEDAEFPTDAQHDAALAWQTTSYVMGGVAGASAVSAVVLGLIRTFGGRRVHDRGRGR
jgi:hypothetical protein